MSTPISGIYKLKGVCDVSARQMEQGIVKPFDEVLLFASFSLVEEFR